MSIVKFAEERQIPSRVSTATRCLIVLRLSLGSERFFIHELKALDTIE